MTPPNLAHFLLDDSGVTATEYAIMLALIIAVLISTINALGGTNVAFWENNVDTITEATGSN